MNPVTNVVRAKTRQTYVLTQMARHGFLDEATAKAEIERPITLAPRAPPQVGQYYVEEIRRILAARYSEDMLLAGGMRVDIAMDPKLQAMADDAVRNGLEIIDRRMGYRGALASLPPERFATLRPMIAQRCPEGKAGGDIGQVGQG